MSGRSHCWRRSIIGAQVARASDGTTTWSQVTGQSAFSGVTLRGVACPTANHCVAVGFSGNNEVILAGDNGTWTSQNPAVPSQNFGTLNSVSCTDASDCVAVGYYTTGGGGFNTYHPLIEAWNGSNWSIVSASDVGDTYNLLLGVDCTGGNGSNQCTAVGYWQNTFGNDRSQHPLVFQGTDTNGTWSFSAASPNPGNAGDSLQAVNCPTSTSCIAVGHSQYAAVWRFRARRPTAPGAGPRVRPTAPAARCPASTARARPSALRSEPRDSRARASSRPGTAAAGSRPSPAPIPAATARR